MIAAWLPQGNLATTILGASLAGAGAMVKDMKTTLRDLRDETETSELNTHKEIVRTLLSGSANRKPK